VVQFDLDEEQRKRLAVQEQQLSLGGADASNAFHLWRTRTNAARRSAR
jgi:hypothetical protein